MRPHSWRPRGRIEIDLDRLGCNINSDVKDSVAKDSVAKDSAAEDSDAKDSAAEESAVKDSAAEDSDAKDSSKHKKAGPNTIDGLDQSHTSNGSKSAEALVSM